MIDPRSVLSPVEFSVGANPKNPANCRMFLSSLQLPIRARSWLATIQPIPGIDIRHSIHWDSSESSLQPTDLSSSFKSLLFRELHVLQKLIELKTHAPRTLKLSKLGPHSQRPLPPAGRCQWKANPFKEQQRFDAPSCLRPSRSQRRNCVRWRSPIDFGGNMNALQLPPTQVLRQPSTIEPIGLHFLTRSPGYHRRRNNQTPIPLRYNPIVQSVACRSSLIGKDYFLTGKVLHMIQKIFLPRYRAYAKIAGILGDL